MLIFKESVSIFRSPAWWTTNDVASKAFLINLFYMASNVLFEIDLPINDNSIFLDLGSISKLV